MQLVNHCRRLTSAVTLCASAVFSTAEAQDVAPPASDLKSLSGFVTDASGRPIENADVSIQQLRFRVRTRRDGAFSFALLKSGKYTVTVRSIGFVETSARVTVRDTGATVRFQLVRAPFSLPSVITTASRGGLSGVIADSAFRPMANVSVRVQGQYVAVRTDSSGAFFIPLESGHYLVRLERDGFVRQLISVTVPEGEGRQMAAWMLPQRGSSNPREGANLFDMDQRVAMEKSPVFSRFYTREDIEKLGLSDLKELVGLAEGKRPNQDCRVLVNGGPRTEPLWYFLADEIEYVEIYFGRPTRVTGGPDPTGGRTAFGSNAAAMSRAQKSADCGDYVGVWLRK